MEKELPTCTICKTRKATRRLNTGQDEGFFFICKRKKCLAAIYDTVRFPHKTKKEFIAEYSHDPLSWQGRSYEKIFGNDNIMGYVAYFGILSVLGMLIYLLS
jgi:hypothetical protein